VTASTSLCPTVVLIHSAEEVLAAVRRR